MHCCVKLLPPVSFKDLVDLDMVLDELWMVTKEEMDFQTEAANLEEFARRNKEIGSKLVDHYIKQVMEDGFFHADPHPGNVKVREGKIVWIDMGMMGRLTDSDREQIGKAIQGIALQDVGLIEEVVLTLGEFKEKPDQSRLYEDIRRYPGASCEIWFHAYWKD